MQRSKVSGEGLKEIVYRVVTKEYNPLYPEECGGITSAGIVEF